MDEPPSWKNFRKSEPPLRMFDLKFVRAGRSKKLATSVPRGQVFTHRTVGSPDGLATLRSKVASGDLTPFLDDPVLERAPILRRVDLPHHDAAETVPFR